MGIRWGPPSTQDALVAAVASAVESIRQERRRQYRKHPHPAGKRFSQEELAEFVYPSYKNLLLGRTRRPPDRDALLTIADYLECTLEERNHLLHTARYALEMPMLRERRLITIAFIDLSPSPALHEPRDVEDIADLLMRLHERCEEAVLAAGGQIVSHVAAALVAVWGARHAREDDALSALRCVWTVKGLLAGAAGSGEMFTMRAGLHTGLTLVETSGSALHVAGDSMNTAYRLHEAVSEGVLLSPSAYRHVRGYVRVTRHAAHAAGTAAVQGYLVLDLLPERGARPEIPADETPHTVGRDEERALMQQAVLDMLSSGVATVVLVEGDAGIGKSRLLEDVLEWSRWIPEPLTYFHGRAHAHSQGMANSLFCDMFVNRFQLMDHDSEEVMLRRFERGFADAMGISAEAYADAHILCSFLGYSAPDHPDVAPFAAHPARLRDRALLAMTRYFRSLAAQTPILMLVEDAHWADDSSLALFRELAARLKDVPVCLVLSTRQRADIPDDWPGLLRVRLTALDTQESRQLVFTLLPAASAPAEAVTQLVIRRAEGNPLFLRELAYMLAEGEPVAQHSLPAHIAPAVVPGPVPTTLMSILYARLAALPPAELVTLQMASVVGRTFWDTSLLTIMAAAAPDALKGNAALMMALDGLRGRMLIVRPRDSLYREHREFRFGHVLMRDAAYSTILKRDRQVYHRGAALWLLDALRRGVFSNEYAAVLAGHYEAAELPGEAIMWYQEAARYAMARGAHTVAQSLLRHALGLARSALLPASVVHLLESLYAFSQHPPQ
jgi:class 3 adenylate cyclase